MEKSIKYNDVKSVPGLIKIVLLTLFLSFCYLTSTNVTHAKDVNVIPMTTLTKTADFSHNEKYFKTQNEDSAAIVANENNNRNTNSQFNNQTINSTQNSGSIGVDGKDLPSVKVKDGKVNYAHKNQGKNPQNVANGFGDKIIELIVGVLQWMQHYLFIIILLIAIPFLLVGMLSQRNKLSWVIGKTIILVVGLWVLFYVFDILEYVQNWVIGLA